MSRSAPPHLAVAAAEQELRRARLEYEAAWDAFMDNLPPQVLAVCVGDEAGSRVPFTAEQRSRPHLPVPDDDKIRDLERSVRKAVAAAARAAGGDTADDELRGQATTRTGRRPHAHQRPPPRPAPLLLLTDRRPVGPPAAPSPTPSRREELAAA